MSSRGRREPAINWSSIHWRALVRIAIGLLGWAAVSYFAFLVLVATGEIGGASALWGLFEAALAIAIAAWMARVVHLLAEIRDRLPAPTPAPASGVVKTPSDVAPTAGATASSPAARPASI